MTAVRRYDHRQADDPACAEERVDFLTGSQTPHRVRRAIAASWVRSRESGVAADRVQVPYTPDPDVDTPLARSAEPVLQRLFDKLNDRAVSLILTDAYGLVLSRRTHDTTFERRLDRVLLAPGFSYAERFAGTNGIGTALESGSSTHVFGHEHYAENLETFACAAVPIHDRLSGRVAGVVNLTCRRCDADPLLVTLAETTAEQIEHALQADAGLRELGMLQAYRQTCRRTSGLVLAVSADAVTVNDRARTELGAPDQAAVLAHVRDAGVGLAAGARRSVDVDLPSGLRARLHLHRVAATAGGDGLVVQVRPIGATHRPVATAGPPPGLVGESVTRPYLAALAALRAGRSLAVVGEPGVGKHALLRAALQGRRRVVVNPATDAGWRDALESALGSGVPVVILHADGTDWPAGVPTNGGWVAATCAADAPVSARFADVVEVAPLRRRLDELPALVRHLLDGTDATCSAEAMGMLLRADWPGNVTQLRRVLASAGRRSGRIEAADLPAELHATIRRVLTSLESIERDAIVRALADTDGHRARAAKALGISRATMYRRIRDYGITAITAG